MADALQVMRCLSPVSLALSLTALSRCVELEVVFFRTEQLSKCRMETERHDQVHSLPSTRCSRNEV